MKRALLFMNKGGGMDIDAQAYINASGNSAHETAINTLFVSLKSAGIYTKLQAFYPFLGTTATQHKWNAKNPLDTDAAFRLVFTGGATFSDLGYQLDGSSYANTFFIPSAVQDVNSNGLTLACGTNNAAFSSDTVDFGVLDSLSQASLIVLKNNNSNYNKLLRINGDINIYSGAGNESRGIITGTKQSATVTDLFWNGTQVATGNSGGTLPNHNIFIGAVNAIFYGLSIYGYSSQRIQFTAIHGGLSDAEVVSFHTIINAFENAIGRKTW